MDNTIADYVADLRAPTPSAAAELAIPDIMSVIANVKNERRRLDSSIRSKLQEMNLKLQRLSGRLSSLSPEKTLNNKQQYLASLTDTLHNTMKNRFNLYKNRLEVSIARLDGLSPTAKLRGGYGYIESGEGPLLTVNGIKEGNTLKITLHDGSIDTIVNKVERDL